MLTDVRAKDTGCGESLAAVDALIGPLSAMYLNVDIASLMSAHLVTLILAVQCLHTQVLIWTILSVYFE